MVVLQPTSFCNIDCSYCYLPNRMTLRRMSDEVMCRALEFILTDDRVSPHLCITWHAGEPLTVPRPFYELAFQRARVLSENIPNSHIELTHTIQTNGLLLDQDWCDLFLKYGIHVGLSLDGPSNIHDARRKTRSGQGTFFRVMSALELLVRNKVPFGVITVLSRQAVADPDLLFEFYRRHSIRRIALNVDEVTGNHRVSSLMDDDVVEIYKRFMARMLVLSETSGYGLHIKDLTRYRRHILHAGDPVLNQLCKPLAMLNIDCDGNFSTFCPELLTCTHARYREGFTIGNIQTDTLDLALSSARFHSMWSEILAGVGRCREECDYFDLCGGGAPSNKLFENGTFDSSETNFCRFTRKAVIDVSLAALETKLNLC